MTIHMSFVMNEHHIFVVRLQFIHITILLIVFVSMLCNAVPKHNMWMQMAQETQNMHAIFVCNAVFHFFFFFFIFSAFLIQFSFEIYTQTYTTQFRKASFSWQNPDASDNYRRHYHFSTSTKVNESNETQIKRKNEKSIWFFLRSTFFPLSVCSIFIFLSVTKMNERRIGGKKSPTFVWK